MDILKKTITIMQFKLNINKRPHTKGLHSNNDCSIFIDMNGNTVTRIGVINYLNEIIKYEVNTDQCQILVAYINRNAAKISHLYTKLNNSSWLEVCVRRESDNSLVEKKRVTLN